MKNDKKIVRSTLSEWGGGKWGRRGGCVRTTSPYGTDHTWFGEMKCIFVPSHKLLLFREFQRPVTCFSLQYKSSTNGSLSDRNNSRSFLNCSSPLFNEAIRALCENRCRSWSCDITKTFCLPCTEKFNYVQTITMVQMRPKAAVFLWFHSVKQSLL